MAGPALSEVRPKDLHAQRQWLAGVGPGTKAALLTLLVGALCLILAPHVPWLAVWPKALTVPATDWIGIALGWLLEGIRPVARWFSALLDYPMRWSTLALVRAPYPLTIAIVVALGWYLGGRRMALGALAGLGFVLGTGYWQQGMNTLALVAVSVPLALLAGGAIGLLAHEVPPLRRVVQTLLDIMQTVPTFAYLTPLLLLFGFGPVVGLIASAIYAAPPMARNVLLALDRVEPDIREAAVMSGTTRWQQLFLVEIPSVSRQIMVGVNQTIMAALSMVIIAAVIGGFDDIGWEVLLTMRKADFGHSLIAGLVIVIFAILIDRMSGALIEERQPHSVKVSVAIIAAGLLLSLMVGRALPAAGGIDLFGGIATQIDAGLGRFTAAYGAHLDAIRNGAMYFVLLPLRIGLDQSVLPFTWGFAWTPALGAAYFAVAALAAIFLGLRGRILAGVLLMIAAGVVETGISQLPWPFVLFGAGALGWVGGGRGLATYAVLMLVAILVMGLWAPAMLSLYLSGAAVLACAVAGGALGLASAVNPGIWRIVRPICDLLQTIPLFVFLIPVLMFFQIGEFSAFLAICAYAVVPMIRYTQHGLTSTPDEMVEAAVSSGATTWQTLVEVRAPYAAPAILLGLNQTILYAFSMLVIAALIGTTDLGQQIYLALGQGDVGLGVAAGAAMAILALVADRLVQGFAEERRKALGL